MNALSAIVLFAAVVAASAGLAPIDSAAVIAGPSGTVVRSGLSHVAAPLAVAHAAPLAYAHAPLAVAHAAPLAVAHAAPYGLIVPAGSGLEGQWIPDINEKLYDDGSYKPHVYGF